MADVMGRNETETSTKRPDKRFGTEVKNGKFLTEPKSKARRQAQKLWDSQNRWMERRFAQWKVNALRHAGYPNVALVHHDDGKWDYYIPPNVTPDQIPLISELGKINRQLASVLFADPPAPNVVPFSRDDDEIQAAIIAQRVLEDVDSESMLSDTVKARRAFTKASDYGSGFIYYYVDPKGAGLAPIQIEAHPAATHVTNALNHPETGAPLPPPYVKRYVREDGSLTDIRSEAALRDIPSLKSRVLTGKNVRFIPHNAEDIWDADGIMLGEFITWGRLKNIFQDKLTDKNLSKERIQKILEYRPQFAEDIAAWDQDINAGDDDENQDERLVWVLTIYFRRTADYPRGARIVVVGGPDGELVYRGDWAYKRDDGTVEVCDIPLTQYAQWSEGRDDPYHVGTSEIVGRGQGFLESQVALILDHLDRLNNRKVFVNIHSLVQESDLMRKDKRYIRTAGDKPEYEDVPTIPSATNEWVDRVAVAMGQSVGLGDTTTGLEDPSVKSGRHALAIVQQAHATLSELRENIVRAYERAGRIKLQLIRKHFKTPRDAGWTNEDDEFRLESWSRVNLGNARDVKIAPGTMTMLTPVAKAQLAEHYFTLGILDQFKMYDIFSNSLGGTLGLQDDPVRLRIRRQIAEWKMGPPEGWEPPPPLTQMDPVTGQEIQQPGPDPILEKIWEPVPADFVPEVAMIRVNELIKLMSSKKYIQKPKEWKSRVEMEFQAMMQASMPPIPGQPTADQQNQGGTPADQVQANDLAGLTDSAVSPGQGLPSPDSAQGGVL